MDRSHAASISPGEGTQRSPYKYSRAAYPLVRELGVRTGALPRPEAFRSVRVLDAAQFLARI